VPGFEVAARFHAAGEDVQVGGDFFDVFETDDGEWAAVIGDVSGKGADAAAVTALARYTVRAVAVRGRRPSTVLRELNDAVLRHDLEDRFCTAAFARLRGGPDRCRVQLSSGGHPLPLLVTPEGDVRVVGRPGTALGIAPDPRLHDREVELHPGDKLVFVTDGVIEARVAGRRMLGVDGLNRLLAGCGPLDAVATGERIEQAIVGEGEPRDDIAVLVLRAAGDRLPERGREGLVRAARWAASARSPSACRAGRTRPRSRARRSRRFRRAASRRRSPTRRGSWRASSSRTASVTAAATSTTGSASRSRCRRARCASR
jgi:Stage II sporulation protein E (SpoIIE)